MAKNPVIVQSHRPWRWLAWFAVSVGLAVVCAWYAYQQGNVDAVGDLAGLQVENAMLSQVLEQVMDENTGLREQNALLGRAAQVEQQAYREVDKTLTELQAERMSLKEELAFYRGIVSDTRAKGLVIRHLEITPQATGSYELRLVLTRHMKNGKVIKGKVDIVVTGSQDGEATDLSLQELAGVEHLDLNIKHFQRLEISLELPAGFIPDIVSVVVTPRGKREKKVEQSYPWPDLSAD